MADTSLGQKCSSSNSISHSRDPGIKRSQACKFSSPSMIGEVSLRLSSFFNQTSCQILMELPSPICHLHPCVIMPCDDHILFQI